MSRKAQPSAAAVSPLRAPPLEIRLPPLPRWQEEVYRNPARFKVIAAGRQSGKTHFGAVTCVAAAIQGKSVWWVAPTFDLTERGWLQILDLVGRIPGVRSEGRPVWRVRLPTGGVIQARSADNPDSLRGATLDGLVFDECAAAKPEAWPVLRPSLSVRQGWGLFISTPKGLNWFHDLYAEAEAREGWARWRFASTDSPFASPEDVEMARADMSSLLFSQEYLAEFIAASESQFRAEWIRRYRTRLDGPDRLYILGDDVVALANCSTFHTVDLAWSQAEGADYTVVATWVLTPRNHLILADCLRGHFEGPDVAKHLERVYGKWGGLLVVERATRQMSIIQEAVRRGLPVREVRAEKDKVARSWPAQARMEQGTVWFPPASTPWWPDLEEELLAFPAGRHDDFVDCLSYACLQVAERRTMDMQWI